MTKIALSCLFLLILFSCGRQDPSIQKEKLSGYWEIESVTFPDGSKKYFSVNKLIDFIEVSEANGKRTKVAPQLDGSFINNGVIEQFNLLIEGDSLRLYYNTPFDTWKETVLVTTDTVLKIMSRDSQIYTYKKFLKFNFEKE